jgi:hypothetical protein
MKTRKILLISAVYLACFCFSNVVSGQKESQSSSPDITIANPAYEKGKGPKVMFDEGHNNHRNTESYKALVDIITNDGYSVVVNKGKFTEDVLKGHDILIISNALHETNVSWWDKTRPYYPAFTQEEVDAVHKWVEKGGGLFLVADHEPFGTAAFNLAKKFCVIMSEGNAYDQDNPDVLTVGTKGGLFSRGHIVLFTRENGTLLDHPITRGRNKNEKIDKIRTFGGQSMLAPNGSGLLMFSESAFDIAPLTEEKRQIPHHLQGAALGYGAGRVLIFGEAQIFRFQAQNSGGNVSRLKAQTLPADDSKKFLLNIMHYLSGLLEPGLTLNKCQ